MTLQGRWAKHHAMVDDQKWSSAIAYVRAYNEYRAGLSKYNDAFHPVVIQLWDNLLLAQREFKRMAKK